MTSSVNHNNTLGALQFGGSVVVFLFGVETLQTYYYFKKYPNDRLWLKLLVIWIWLEEIGHAMSVLAGMYILTVTEFGESGALHIKTIPIGYAWSIVFSGSVGPIVEAFFARRMYLLSGRMDLPLIALTLTSLRFVGSMIAASKVFEGISLEEFSTKWGWLNTTCFCAGAGADIIIAIGQCYFIYREKNRAIAQTLKLLDRLLAYTMETGLALSLTAVMILLLWGINPRSFWWFGIFLFYTEVFANSLMVALNTRQAHGDAGEVLQNSDCSTILSRNSQRHKKRYREFEPEDRMSIELPVLGPRFFGSFSYAQDPLPQYATNHSIIAITIPQEVSVKHHRSVDLESQTLSGSYDPRHVPE